jgi:hypothetical protein
MNIQTKTPTTPLRRRMTEDMAARKLGRLSQRGPLASCERFAAFLGRSPETATADDIRRFQLFVIEIGARASLIASHEPGRPGQFLTRAHPSPRGALHNWVRFP